MHIDTSALERCTQANPEPPTGSTPPRTAVLVVDNDPLQVRDWANILSESGRVYTALDAQEALKTLATHDDIAVVITDIDMPVHDGEWLIERIRLRHPQVRIVCSEPENGHAERLRPKVDRMISKHQALQDIALIVSLLVMEAGLG